MKVNGCDNAIVSTWRACFVLDAQNGRERAGEEFAVEVSSKKKST
jgi:hypothetical protein